MKKHLNLSREFSHEERKNLNKKSKKIFGQEKLDLRKLKFRRGYWHKFSRKHQRRIQTCQDYINDRLGSRIVKNGNPESPLYRKLYLIIAVHNNRVVGVVNYWKGLSRSEVARVVKKDPWHRYITVFVPSKFRRQGIGTRLFKRVYRLEGLKKRKGFKRKRELFPPAISKATSDIDKYRDFLRDDKGDPVKDVRLCQSENWYDLMLKRITSRKKKGV